MRPVFLCKKDLDTALSQLSSQGESIGKREVIVVDLLGYLLQLQEDIEEGIDGIEVRGRPPMRFSAALHHLTPYVEPHCLRAAWHMAPGGGL